MLVVEILVVLSPGSSQILTSSANFTARLDAASRRQGRARSRDVRYELRGHVLPEPEYTRAPALVWPM